MYMYIYLFNIWSHHFMGNRWGNSGDFILGGSKITADGDCHHEIKRRLLLGRKVMTNLDSIFKTRGITLPTKVRLVKAMVVPVVMYGCESWTIKKAHQASLSINKSRSLIKPMSIKSLMPSNHLIFYHPLLILHSIFPSIRVFSNESVLHIRGQSIGVSASVSVLPMNIQDWFPLGLSGWISL